MKVICPNCKRSFWETTDQYDPDKRPNGSMVRQLPQYAKNKWPVFGDGVMVATRGTLAAEMDCPACLAQLAPSGRLTVIPDKEIREEGHGTSDGDKDPDGPVERPPVRVRRKRVLTGTDTKGVTGAIQSDGERG